LSIGVKPKRRYVRNHHNPQGRRIVSRRCLANAVLPHGPQHLRAVKKASKSLYRDAKAAPACLARWRKVFMKASNDTSLPALRRVAEQFARLSAAVFDGVLIYDAGIVLDATPGAAQLLGRSSRELHCCRVNDLVTTASRVKIEQQLGSLEHVRCAAIAQRADGSTLPIELSVEASVTIAGRRVQVVALRDASLDEESPHLTDRTISRKKALHAARN